MQAASANARILRFTIKATGCVAIMLLSAGCTSSRTKQQQAEKLVEQYLNDAGLNHCENLQFSALDTVYTNYMDDPAYAAAALKKDSLDKAYQQVTKSNSGASSDIKSMDELEASASYAAAYSKARKEQVIVLNNLANQFKTKIKGLTIYTICSNTAVTPVSDTIRFELDTTLTTVKSHTQHGKKP